MKAFVKFFLNNKALTWLLLILIIAGGVVAYSGMGKLEDAPFTIKQAVVTTTYPGASPLEVQQQVTSTCSPACGLVALSYQPESPRWDQLLVLPVAEEKRSGMA